MAAGPAVGVEAGRCGQVERVVEAVELSDGVASELGDRVGNVGRVAVGDDQPRRRSGVVGLGQRFEFVAGDGRGAVGIEVGVDRERGVPAGLALDCGVEPDQQVLVDRPAGGRDPLGDAGREVGRAHPPLPGVSVVDADDGHGRRQAVWGKGVSRRAPVGGASGRRTGESADSAAVGGHNAYMA
ncbi:hypothetical protein SY89_00424 [Halolamina pelagica]|uniref:Uncharacterized protein n=1 Tax=Halolamina pelagica TaxID=699431 RepID=A0A0P7HSQ2_9EURY|nr:hypothetical protein SY89_00424 [Halolamina pelagica]